MKKLFAIITVSAISATSFCQIPIYDTGRVNINEAIAPFTSDGTLNFLSSGCPGYIIPKDSQTATIFCGALWVGGLDAGSQLHIAAQTYHQNGTDFWPGPMMDSINYSTHEDTIWNHVWLVYKSTIDSFRAGKFGSHVPASILNWPGNGDVSLGEMAALAPYVDSAHSGYYNPSAGDYPLIRGDMAAYTIFNDDRGAAHTETGGKKLGIEVHLMAYQFSSADTALNQTTFLHYDIYNRSQNNYDSVYFGNFIDIEVGDGQYNYVGCDSANNYWYGFNPPGTDSQGTGAYACEKGFNNDLAAQAIVYLCDTMTHFIYSHNDFTVMGNPVGTIEYYNYLQSIWTNGNHLTYGDSGYGGNEPTNLAFTGNPVTLTGWSEVSGNVPPIDLRGISSIGPVAFNAHTSRSIDLALVFAQPAHSDTNLGDVLLLPSRVTDVKNFYQSQNYGCDAPLLGVNEIKSGTIIPGLSVFPNPASNEFYVKLNNVPGKINLTLYNILGEQVYCSASQSNNLVEIPVTNLPAGLYVLKAQLENGAIMIGKVEVAK